MSSSHGTMTADDARHALWVVGDPRGWEPGGFTASLLEALGKADRMNRARLWVSFPGLVQAVTLAQTEHGRNELAKFADDPKSPQ